MTDGRPRDLSAWMPGQLEVQLRELAVQRPGAGIVDDLELRHLVSVILHGALLVQDLYGSERVETIYGTDPRAIARNLISPMLAANAADAQRSSDAGLVMRTGHLPDEVRLVGDKCLFDVGISGIRRYRGLDLQDLGVRAYRMASEVLEILADDRELREFFDRNRLAPLPLVEEVAFLKQCAERFAVHADLLLHLPGHQSPERTLPDSASGTAVPVTPSADDSATGTAVLSPTGPGASELASAAAAAMMGAPAGMLEGPDPVFDAGPRRLTRDEMLAAYERIILFASLDVDALRKRLAAIVVDQGEAVEALCDELALCSAGTHNLTRPASYFLVGPTGVGKNHLVETLARLLGEVWSVEIPVLTIDGPNFTDPSDINELRGSTRGFIRSDEEGLLSEFHARASTAPLSFILVDEVEKAHPHLRKFFLSMMDRGTVTDNRGKVLGFSGSILFFTSNIGFSEALTRPAPIGYRGEEEKVAFEDSDFDRGLRCALSAEFMNRVRILRFAHLSRTSIEKIFEIEFAKVRDRFREIHGIELWVTSAARDEILARGYSYDFGARHLATVINAVANVEVSKRLKRDEGPRPPVGLDVLGYLREIRKKERAFDPREVRARVFDAARARVSYHKLTIDYDGEAFVYQP